MLAKAGMAVFILLDAHPESTARSDFLMKLFGLYTSLIAACLAICYPLQADAQLYVVQVGDGVATLTNASTATYLNKFSTTGTLEGTLSLPIATSGANLPLTMSGTATSEGFLSLSANGDFLMLGGYGVAPGTASVANSTSVAVPRVAAKITLADEIANMTIDTTTGLTDTFSGNNIRSVASSDGTNIWLAGSNFGTRYSTTGATTSTQVSGTPSNLRVAKIFNGQLYVSNASASTFGINQVGTGLPTETGTTSTMEINTAGTGTGNASPYDYWFKDSNTVYIADDRSVTGGGGIQKWTQSEDVWSLAYTLNVDAGTGFRGVTGTVVGGQTVLYATTTQGSANRLLTVTDLGSSSPLTLLATAPTNTAFRGLVFVESGGETQQPGDFDGDGDVDGRDFLMWQRGESTPGGPLSSSDLVDWQTNYGTGTGPLTAVTAVPEPGFSTLILTSIIMVMGLRKSAAGR
jgi:hypothetical protein